MSAASGALAAGNATPSGSPETRLRGRWLLAARAVWLVLAVGLLVHFVVNSVRNYTTLSTLCTAPPQACPFHQLTSENAPLLQPQGLTLEHYAAILGSIDLFVSLVFVAVALVIFWRKSDAWIGLLTSFLLLTFGSLGPSGNFVQDGDSPLSTGLVVLLVLAVWPALAVFLFTFPTGRFTPRWTWLLVPLWAVATLGYNFPSPYNVYEWPLILQVALFGLTFGSAAGVQLYRYWRVYTQGQRQQTKWVVFGFVVGLGATLAYSGVAHKALGVSESGPLYQASPLANVVDDLSVVPTFLPLLVGLALAVLRYRLWDVDSLINRALVYTLLTILLASLYGGLILGLEHLAGLVTGQEDQPVAIVLSTLAIAALFLPLRQRLQALIDRRFFRKKYDADQTLAAFSATLRNQVDLEQIRTQVLSVVQETMQPAHVSLWLQAPERPGGETPHRLEPHGPVPAKPSDG